MRLPSLLLPPCLTVCAIAQPQNMNIQPLPARGMMPAYQAGMTFTHAPNTIVCKQPQLPVQLATFVAASNSPKYNIPDIAAYIATQITADFDLEVDAMSTGNDVLPLVYDPANPPRYKIQTGQSNGWATLFLTVSDTDNATIGANIYGYYFDNVVFPPGLRRAVYHEIVRADYASGPYAPPSTSDILALDVNMGLIHSTMGFPDPGVLPDRTHLYFSLSHASAQQLVEGGFVVDPDPVDGAAIWVATYNSSGLLTHVGLHCTGADLGVPERANVDALGVAVVDVATPPYNPAHVALNMDSWDPLESTCRHASLSIL